MPEDALHPTDQQRAVFRRDLISWYAAEKREMPWRGANDPYRIWVAEVMLQQTRVDQARPYYERFLEAFPSVEALAAADRDHVLRRWEGLGYYARARHLHDAARRVAEEYGGRVPSDYDTFRTLPGVGPYTAAAVLSIAFGKPHAVLDGNVARVLSRVFTIEEAVNKSGTHRRLRALAGELLDPNRSGDFNQALMELGATRCTPTRPACPACPLRSACGAFAEGTQANYPVKKKKAPVPHHDVAVGLVFNDADEVLIQRRPEDGLLGGLWEFPGGKQQDDEPLETTCRRELKEELSIDVEVEALFHRLDHAYSHFKITLHAFRCRIQTGTPHPNEGQPLRWIAIDALSEYAFPRANRRLIEELKARERSPTLFDE